LTNEEAIQGIEARERRLYVPAMGSAGGVIVARNPSGEAYLKTEGNSQQPDRLLSLVKCASGRK